MKIPIFLITMDEKDEACRQCPYIPLCLIWEIECDHINQCLTFENLESLNRPSAREALRKQYEMPIFEKFEAVEDSEKRSTRNVMGIPKPPPHEERMKELKKLGMDEGICELCPIQEHCSYLKWLCWQVREKNEANKNKPT